MTTLTQLSLQRYEELPIEKISDYPVLSGCINAWNAERSGETLPSAMNMDLVPTDALPYTMLLDYLPRDNDVRVRMAGNYIGERSQFRSGLEGLRGFFDEGDARIIYESMVRIAQAKKPGLARRDYVSIEGRRYQYVRLIVPLSADGVSVTGFFKTIEPATLRIT